MLDQLKVAEDARSFDHLSEDHMLAPATVIDKPEGVFPRIVDEDDAEKVA